MSSYEEAKKIAAETDKNLTANQFSGTEWVHIVHEEGAQLFFRNAFIKEWKDWVLIFTEHHKTHVYHKTDLKAYRHLKELPIDKLKGTRSKDTCLDCKLQFDVDNLIYKPHPAKDCNSPVPLCSGCYDSAEEYSAECDK